MTRMEYLRQQIDEMRENGAEPEDISQVVQELNMEIAKSKVVAPEALKGGGKAVRKKKESKTND